MILDTDFLISLLRKRPEAIQKLEQIKESENILFISHVNLWELYTGAYKSHEQEENIERIDKLREFFEILPFTETIDRRFGFLQDKLEKEGNPIGVMDTLIACIALEYNLPVVTKNIKHFERTDVIIETW